jgi:hypothetical protein
MDVSRDEVNVRQCADVVASHNKLLNEFQINVSSKFRSARANLFL